MEDLPGALHCYVTDTIMNTNSTRRIALVFPGQGSQSVGMLADLAANHEIIANTFAEASAALGYDLWDIACNGPESELNRTEITQPALLSAGVAVWRPWLQEQGSTPEYMAGHSLGEYTALVCSGVLKFSDAVRLVRDRGRYMQQAVPQGTGGMAAILGLDSSTIEKLCLEAAAGEIVSAANYNSPEQTVIAGNVDAVARATELCKTAGAKRAILLPVSVPSHCALMKTAAMQLQHRLDEIDFAQPQIPVLQNVDAQARSSAEEIKAALVRQLHQPVRWVDTINGLAGLDCQMIIESGPGKVLAGLIKRINKDITTLVINDPATFQQIIKETQT